MSYLFSGTITLGVIDYPATAVFSRSTNRLTGTVYLTSTTVEFPLGGISMGTSFQTPRQFFFTGPSNELIGVDVIPKEDTSIDAQFSAITFSATITIDAIPSTMEGTFSRVIERISTPGIEQTDLTAPETTRHQLTRVRINEVGNILDHFGMLLSLPRNDGEDNRTYKARIMKASFRKPGSSYHGLMNGIVNALGIDTEKAIRITTKQTIDQGERRLLLDDGKITIYSDWVSREDQLLGLRPTIEQQATLDSVPIKTIGELVDWINTSDFYSATLLSNRDASSELLLKADSRLVHTETIKPQERIRLKYGSILRGSVSSRTSDALVKEVASSDDFSESGDYAINYMTGLLSIHTPGKEDVKVSYLTSLDDFYLDYSPVKIMDLSQKSVHQVLFSQVPQTFYQTVEESTVNGMPTDDLYEIIRELVTAGDFDQFWGE